MVESTQKQNLNKKEREQKKTEAKGKSNIL